MTDSFHSVRANGICLVDQGAQNQTRQALRLFFSSVFFVLSVVKSDFYASKGPKMTAGKLLANYRLWIVLSGAERAGDGSVVATNRGRRAVSGLLMVPGFSVGGWSVLLLVTNGCKNLYI